MEAPESKFSTILNLQTIDYQLLCRVELVSRLAPELFPDFLFNCIILEITKIETSTVKQGIMSSLLFQLSYLAILERKNSTTSFSCRLRIPIFGKPG